MDSSRPYPSSIDRGEASHLRVAGRVRPATRVYTAEPRGFDDARRSLEAGERVRNDPGASSICDALRKRKAAVSWCDRINALPPEQRSDSEWHYVLLGEDTFYGWRDKGGSIAPSAGNMTILQAVDEQIIRIKNDTCSDYYLRVYADDPRCDQDAGPGDAGDARPQDSGSDASDDAPAD